MNFFFFRRVSLCREIDGTVGLGENCEVQRLFLQQGRFQHVSLVTGKGKQRDTVAEGDGGVNSVACLYSKKAGDKCRELSGHMWKQRCAIHQEGMSGCGADPGLADVARRGGESLLIILLFFSQKIQKLGHSPKSEG